MTRELSHKAATVLLRTAFQDKGAPITHTEALDLLARLKGYEAWSHLQQVAAQVAKGTQPLTTKKSRHGYVSVQASLMLQYGPDGECPAYGRVTWKAQEPATPYWDWVVDCLHANGTWQNPADFVVAPAVAVTLPDGSASCWHIETNLSDRWGEINDAHWGTKSGLPVLHADEALLGRLQSQMCDEVTFIVRKDGQFGLLYEVEYLCRESEANNEDDECTYAPRVDVVADLLKAITEFEKQYPQVQFCIPNPEQIFWERPAIWGFTRLDSLGQDQREALSMALHRVF